MDFPGFLRKWKAVEEYRKAVEEVGKPFQKAESRLRNRKAVEEIGKPMKKIFSDFLEMRKLLKKINFEQGKSDLTKGFCKENRILRKDFVEIIQ